MCVGKGSVLSLGNLPKEAFIKQVCTAACKEGLGSSRAWNPAASTQQMILCFSGRLGWGAAGSDNPPLRMEASRGLRTAGGNLGGGREQASVSERSPEIKLSLSWYMKEDRRFCMFVHGCLVGLIYCELKAVSERNRTIWRT